jgi:hypothetical protein
LDTKKSSAEMNPEKVLNMFHVIVMHIVNYATLNLNLHRKHKEDHNCTRRGMLLNYLFKRDERYRCSGGCAEKIK